MWRSQCIGAFIAFFFSKLSPRPSTGIKRQKTRVSYQIALTALANGGIAAVPKDMTQEGSAEKYMEKEAGRDVEWDIKEV